MTANVYRRKKTGRLYFWNEKDKRWFGVARKATWYNSTKAAIRADVEAERVRGKDPRLSGPGESPWMDYKAGKLRH